MSDVKGRSGRKQFVATQEQRDIVKGLAGRAVPQALICRVILNPQTGRPISEPTLRRAFRSEIDTGQTLVSAMVGSVLVSAALGTKPPCGLPIKGDMARLKAAMFFLERRAGWTQGFAPQASGKLRGRTQHQDVADLKQWLLAELTRVRERAAAAEGVTVEVGTAPGFQTKENRAFRGPQLSSAKATD